MTAQISSAKDSSTSHMFRCTFCNQSFNRREHLTRHLRSHTQEKPFHCPICQKSFSRPDVLNRHVATHEGKERAPLGTAPRACKQCAADRVKCSREHPCRRCSARELSCEYPTTRESRMKARKVVDEECDEFSRVLLSATSSGPGLNERLSHMGTNASKDGSQQDDDHVLDTPTLEGSTVSWAQRPYLSESDAITSLKGFKRDCVLPNEGNGAQTHLGTAAAMPYRSFSIQSKADSALSVESGAVSIFNTPHSLESSDPPYSDSHIVSTTDGTSAYSSPYSAVTYMTDAAEESDILPHSSYYSRSSAHDELCSSAAYEALVHNVFTTNEVFSVQISITEFPSYDQTRTFVHQYFDNFHPVFAFLRRSSFGADAIRSWVLLLAVAAVGAKFSRFENDRSKADVLLRCLSIILHRKHYGLDADSLDAESAQYRPGVRAKPTASPDISLLQAAVLNFMCLMNSGKSAYVHRALMERYYLVHACVTLRLLSGNEKIYDIRSSTKSWLEQESRIRTGLMIWFVDTLSRYVFDLDVFDGRPSIGLQDIQVMLPSHDEIWEHPETAINGARSYTTVTFLGVVEMIYTDKRLPPDVGDYAFNILSHAIYHNTVTVLLHGQLLSSHWLPKPIGSHYKQHKPEFDDTASPLPIASRWRNDALLCLDLFFDRSLEKVAHNNGVEHSTILFLHLARQIVLAPTTNFQALATGLLTAQQPQSGNHNARIYANTREAVLKWVMKDQCKARLTLVTAGAIFWHVRHYSRGSFLEPHGILLSTLVLWSFCMCMQIPEVLAALDESAKDPPKATFIHLDGPLDDGLVEEFAERGHKMTVFVTNVGSLKEPEAAANVLLEGISLLRKDFNGSGSAQGIAGYEQHGHNHVWGIEESYILFLSSLVGVSQDPRVVNIA